MDRRLGIVLENICEQIGWRYAEAWVPDGSGDQLMLLAHWHDGSPLLEKFARESETQPLRNGFDLPGRVLHFGKAETLRDLETVPETVFLRRDAALATGLTSAIGVPVMVNERPCAVLAFYRADDERTPSRALHIASRMAGSAGGAVSSPDTDSAVEADHPLLHKMARFGDLTMAEKNGLLGSFNTPHTFAPGDSLIDLDENAERIFAINTGWGYVQRLLQDGRRQIIHFLLPGDTTWLINSGEYDRGTEVVAITEVEAVSTHRTQLDQLFVSQPRIASTLYWAMLWEQTVLAERLTSLGRRSAFERIGHLLLEVYQRLDFLHLVEDGEFEWPMTQEILADTMGLSIVHVNRTLKELRAGGYIDYNARRHQMRILNPEGLREAIDFEDSELYRYEAA